MMTATTRVIRCSFFLPTSPSLERRSSAGIATPSSCMMMDALMYGVMDMANSVE